MTIEEDVIAVLEDADLDVYTGEPPRDAPFPYVTVKVISNPTFIRSHTDNEMYRPRFQVDVWAESYQSCVETAETVKGALDINKIDFKMATKENELDLPEEEAGLFHRILDFFVYHT